jgi:hypothetical protein
LSLGCKAGNDEKRITIYLVQTELFGKVAAMVKACIKHKPERFGVQDAL